MSLRAIILDLGGTLIDWPDWNEDVLRRWALSYDYLIAKFPSVHWPERAAYTQAMRQVEIAHWVEVVANQTSSTPAAVLSAGFALLERPVSEEELLAALDGYGEAVSGWAIIFPDVVETLITLRKRGYKLGLLSNTWWASAWHNADLAAHGLTNLLDEVVYTSDLAYSKPHPEAFRTITRRLGVVPEECIMVGDRLVDDISGALGVGMRAVWKKTHYPWPEPAHIIPTAIITDLAEVLPLVEAWSLQVSG